MSARHYELMVILDPDLEEKTVQPSLDTFLNVIRQSGGSVEKLDLWGRRRLAYAINKKSEGIYAVIQVTAEPSAVVELDRQLNLNEAVLRTKVLRPEPVKVRPVVEAQPDEAPAAEAPAAAAPSAEAPAAAAPAADAPAAEAPVEA